jgi:ribosomal protein S8
MNNIIWQLLKLLRKPLFLILILLYFISLIGVKIFFNISSVLNIFTILLIPATIIIAYITLKSINSDNIEDEIFDYDLKSKYFGIILPIDKNNLERLFHTRNDIKKILKKSNLNQSKQGLIEKIHLINFNDLIQKYANNSVKLKFIEDFLNKKNYKLNSTDNKLKQLNEVNLKYRKLNDDIINSFDSIQAQAVLILADDISTDMYSKDTIANVMDKIKNLEASNEEINKFYISLHKGDTV